MDEDKNKRLIKDHLMLPVLIELDLELQAKDNQSPLLRVIGDQLKGLIDYADSIPPKLLKHLLKQKWASHRSWLTPLCRSLTRRPRQELGRAIGREATASDAEPTALFH